jgi:putative flippase GtrA
MYAPRQRHHQERESAVSPALLIRAAGAATVAAGVLFVGVQIGHPPLDLDFITTTEAAVRNTMKVLMAVLALAGITGMYLSQVRRNGVLGLVGYLILAAGYLLIMSSTYGLAYVLSPVADTAPSYVTDVLHTFSGRATAGDVGALDTLFQVQSACYLAGGLVFGVALYRAGVLARWACALLAVGGLVSAALAVLPDAFYRLIALPNGIALIGLGFSLWRSQRQSDDQPAPATAAEGQPELPAVP